MLKALTRQAAERFAERPALRFEGQTLSYAQLEARVVATALRLRTAGAEPGSVVALWGANSLEWVVTAHAIARLGAVLLPLSTRWTDAELTRALAPLGVGLLVGEAPYAQRASGLALKALSFEQLAARPEAAGPLPDGQSAETPLALVLTSGTTGVPKAVSLSWGALFASATAVSQVLALGPQDAWWLGMPLFHVGGLGILFRCALTGACVVLHSRFEPGRLLAAIAEEGLSVASLVPTMLQALLAELGDRPWPAGLRAAMLGGAAAAPALIARCPVALHTYGLSECGSTATLVRPGDSATARLSSGRPLPGVRLRILDPEGRTLPPGEVGLISLQGPNLMSGYWNHPAASARALQDGWLLTGDYGRLDEEGNLHVAARREDLIVAGGENIYPAEVEAALLAHPGIAAAAVVAMPDERWGQLPCAYVVLGPEAPTESEIDAWLAQQLARFKRPRAYRFLAALPLLANGKIDRMTLRRALEGASHG